MAEFGGATARIMAGLLAFDICLCCPAEKSPHMQAFNWDKALSYKNPQVGQHLFFALCSLNLNFW